MSCININTHSLWINGKTIAQPILSHSDSDCKGSLVCFERDEFDNVPGCQGGGSEGTDYCVDINDKLANQLFYKDDGLRNGSYGLCEGDCDRDSGEFAVFDTCIHFMNTQLNLLLLFF